MTTSRVQGIPVISSVRYDRKTRVWYFNGRRRFDDGLDSIVIKRSDLTAARATDLARALRVARHDRTVHQIITDSAPDEEYSPEEAFVDPVQFTLLDDGRLALRIEVTSNTYYDLDEGHLFTARVRPLIEPLLRRVMADLHTIQADERRTTAPYTHEVVITAATRNKTLQELHDLADGVRRLIEAADSGTLIRETVVDLILGGRADLLIGLPEGAWLDVKSQHYDMSGDRGRISLAEAVSRFCNAEEGGVVVVGMDTKRVPGGEIIRSIKPVPVDAAIIRRYRQAIENRLFPFPTGLSIRSVDTSAHHGLVVISVPPQEEELKPFLVHGAIVNGKTEGAYISIVRRSGEDSIPITAQQIHSTLAAGRALLRRGQLPRNTIE